MPLGGGNLLYFNKLTQADRRKAVAIILKKRGQHALTPLFFI